MARQRKPCPACSGHARTHGRSCPDRPKRLPAPPRPCTVATMVSEDEYTLVSDTVAYVTARNARSDLPPTSRSELTRGLILEGIETKVRPMVAHNSLPNGSRWPEADFATLDLSKGTPHITSGSSYLSVPIEDDAIVRVYCDDGVSNAVLIGRRWYWVDASEGG